MAIGAYLTLTQQNGSYLKSESQVNLGTGFADPLPDRQPLASGVLFELADWSTEISNTVSFGTRTPSAGKVDFHNFSFTRKLDVATTTLFADLCAGRSLRYADLLLTKVNGETETVFAVFGFGTVFLSQLNWASDEEAPKETVALAYGQRWTAYRPINASGQPGKWVVKGWDRVNNKAL